MAYLGQVNGMNGIAPTDARAHHGISGMSRRKWRFLWLKRSRRDAGGTGMSRHEWRLLWLVLVLAFVVRVAGLGAIDFRLDEAWNNVMTQHLWGVVAHGMMLDTHTQLFPILLTAWYKAGLGANEWLARLLPVLFGVGSIGAAYALTRRMFGAQVALYTALLLAISPFHIVHAREVKDTILLVLTGVLAVYFLVRAAEENRPGLWAAYAAAAVAAGYSQFFAGPLLVAVNLWFMPQLRTRKDRFRGWFWANTVAVTAMVPLAVFTFARTSVLMQSDTWWVPKPTFLSLVFFAKTMAFGYSDLRPWFKVAVLVYGMLAGVGALLAFRRGARWAILLILWFCLPIAFAYVVSRHGQSVFLYRSMLVYSIPFYVWSAIALASAPRRAMRAGALGGLALLAFLARDTIYTDRFSLYEHPHRPGHHPPAPVREAAEFVRANGMPGDVVVHSAHVFLPVLYWYGLRDIPQWNVAAIPQYIRGFDSTFSPSAPLPRSVEGTYMTQLQKAVRGRDRVWFVFSEFERVCLQYNAMSVWRWMDSHFVETRHETFGPFDVFLYEKTRGGKDIVVRKRDCDNGVSAIMTYAGGGETTYAKYKPDAALVRVPQDERHGRLRLRFAEDSGAETGARRRVSFAIENRSGSPVHCRAEMFPSDALLEWSSLCEAEPEAGAWTIVPEGNPSPAPGSYEQSVAYRDFSVVGTFAMTGSLALAPGDYRTYVYTSSVPVALDSNREGVALMVAGQNVLPDALAQADPQPAWAWRNGNAITIAASEASASVELRSSVVRPRTARGFAGAYLAFRRTRSAVLTSETPETWPGELTIGPGETQVLAAEIDDDMGRVDIWVYEAGSDGLVYRIFETYDLACGV